MNTRKIALIGVLISAAVIISVVESFIPSVGVPGIKLGLANIMILITLYELGIKEAIVVNLSRVFLASLLRGTIFSMGFFMSLTGAVLSLTVMIVFYLLVKQFSIIGVSVIGAIAHVVGQILIAIIYLGTAYIIYYLPFIALAAIITGVFVGIVSKVIIKTGVIRAQREKYKF